MSTLAKQIWIQFGSEDKGTMFPNYARRFSPLLQEDEDRPDLDALYDPMDDVTTYSHTNLTRKNIWKDNKLKPLFNNLKLVRKGSDIPVDFLSLRGKYLFIVSIPAPLPNSPPAVGCRALIDLYHDLKTTCQGNIDIEMILVVKTRRACKLNKAAAFDELFSAFRCLAIPFSDSKARNNISSYIGLPQVIVVHPLGTVLQHPNAFDFFKRYGSEWARPFKYDGFPYSPFMNDTMEAIERQDEEFRSSFDPIYACIPFDPPFTLPENPLPLNGILECDPSLALYRCDPHVGGGKEGNYSYVGDLAKQYVGLYLCLDGSFMEKLKEVHDNCLAKKQQLEIIVVGVSLFDDPNSFDEELREALNLYNIKSWFLFYSNYKVIRRIWRIYGQGFRFVEDRFVIIPPNGKSCELEGRAVITKLGIDNYPFTRTTILKQRLEALRSLTPDKLFNQTSLVKKAKRFGFNKLQGKKLLIYLCYLESCDKTNPVYELLIENYSKIIGMGTEVVFVPLDDLDKSQYLSRDLDYFPWPYLTHCSSVGVTRQLIFPEENDEDGLREDFLIYVGEGGRILSRHMDQQLVKLLAAQSFSDDLLEEELSVDLFRLNEER